MGREGKRKGGTSGVPVCHAYPWAQDDPDLG